MINRICLVLPLIFSLSSLLAEELWSNLSEGFAAKFPLPPEKINVPTQMGVGYAYQSFSKFPDGGALYSITVIPVDPNILKTKSVEFIETSNIGFIKSMGQDFRKAKTKWTKFGNDRIRLNYEFDFIYSNVPFKGHGFWIPDKNRIIRVSVSYTKNLSTIEQLQAISFLDSFLIHTDNDNSSRRNIMNDNAGQDPLMSLIFFAVMSIIFGFVSYKLAKEKGRNVALWTILGMLPFVNIWFIAFFIGATNLRLEKKIDELLEKVK